MAMVNAIATSKDADTMIITRVMTEGLGPRKVCATVVGRGIKLTKAQ